MTDFTTRSCRILGVAGGSGSGKTTLAKEIAKKLGPAQCLIVSQDNYYIDQSARFTGDGENVNFDHPSSIDFALLAKQLELLKNNHAIEVPQYDFVTHKRLQSTIHVEPHPWIILDGILILSQPGIRDQLDWSVFVSAPEETRFQRRMTRDTQERGRTEEGVQKQFARQVKPMHDEFVETSCHWAKQVVSGLNPIQDCLEKVIARLKN